MFCVILCQSYFTYCLTFIPRIYKRNTSWGSTLVKVTETLTLQRFLKMSKIKPVKTVGYRTAETKRVFAEKMEKELADHIRSLADQYHDLTPYKCCELAFDFKNNDLTDWQKSFMPLHHLSCCTPEQTSLGRATAFNTTTIGDSEESDVPIPLEDTSEDKSSEDNSQHDYFNLSVHNLSL
uniref:Zgc:113274 n=1 Tax=Kryptolebias marmoratus TaxID=37003 RepID=A0A3Q3EU59_KRYMA